MMGMAVTLPSWVQEKLRKMNLSEMYSIPMSSATHVGELGLTDTIFAQIYNLAQTKYNRGMKIQKRLESFRRGP